MRRAILDIDARLLGREFFDVLDAENIHIHSSSEPPPWSPPGTLRLIIEGDRLPEECETKRLRVDFRMRLETYGKQRLVKLEAIVVAGPGD